MPQRRRCPEMPVSSPPLSSPTRLASPSTDTTPNERPLVDIPIEIVTEEEMDFIEASLSAATAAASSSGLDSRSWAPLSRYWRHETSIHLVPKTPPRDIEDSAGPESRRSLFQDFRSHRGLTVSDITNTEWCEKQMEFSLIHGKPKRTEAMIAGSKRHIQLEEEVVEKVQIQIKSIEDSWALKFLNFIVGTNQLFFEGVTRELPVLQLMCYKYLWDNLALSTFPKEHFVAFHHLNPKIFLSDDVNQYIAALGFQAKTLEDVLTYFINTCCSLPPAQGELLLRYELQSDHSLLEEYHFEHDEDWFQNQIKENIKFWMGDREATYVSENENWKCRFCSFAIMCPMSTPANTGAT